MQWDKVKNILLVILLLVDGFLGLTVAGHFYNERRQEKAFAADLAAVLAREDVQYNIGVTVPTQSRIMPLEVDRNRAAEETFAEALLQGACKTELSDTGELTFSNENGFVRIQADGSVRALFSWKAVQASEWSYRQAAKQLLSGSGMTLRGGTFTVDAEKGEVALSATIAGKPVFDRELVIHFQENETVSLSGRWTFDMPYASTGEQERIYNVADVLLSFTAQNPTVRRIDGITLGYQLQLSPSGRLQLTPTWRLATDRGVEFMEAGK